jgi:hypothetical protein
LEMTMKASAPLTPLNWLTLTFSGSAGLRRLGPVRYCSPRHRTPFNSINEGSKCVG